MSSENDDFPSIKARRRAIDQAIGLPWRSGYMERESGRNWTAGIKLDSGARLAIHAETLEDLVETVDGLQDAIDRLRVEVDAAHAERVASGEWKGETDYARFVDERRKG